MAGGGWGEEKGKTCFEKGGGIERDSYMLWGLKIMPNYCLHYAVPPPWSGEKAGSRGLLQYWSLIPHPYFVNPGSVAAGMGSLCMACDISGREQAAQ